MSFTVGVSHLHNPRLAGNTCTLPECCAARRDTARPGDTNKTNGENAAEVSSAGTRGSLTCWKMHRCGKVLEMSSLISSRLDSRSEDPASGQREAVQTRSSRGRLAISSGLTVRLGLRRRGRAGLPLLLRPGQTDVVQV